MIKLLSIVLLICVPCCSLHAQIKLSESKLQTWSGFENPQVVGGKITSGPASKPKLESVETTISVETAVRYKFAQVKALRLPTLEKMTLEPTADGSGFRFRQGTPDGTYRIEYLAFDPDKGIASEEITVVLESGGQLPVVPDPITGNEIDKLVAKAMIDLRLGYASSFAASADAITSGQIKIDNKLQEFLKPLTTKARLDAFAPIDGHLQDKLPRDIDKLRPEAAAFMRELSIAFGKGIK